MADAGRAERADGSGFYAYVYTLYNVEVGGRRLDLVGIFNLEFRSPLFVVESRRMTVMVLADGRVGPLVNLSTHNPQHSNSITNNSIDQGTSSRL